MFLFLPLLALGCITPLGDGDTDTTPPDTHETDTDADADTDTTPASEVLVDLDGELGDPDGWGDYVDFHVDYPGEPTWIHILLTSAEVADLNGILQTPTEACALQVPYWTNYMEDQEGAHQNQGWVRLEEPGRYTLSVFGAPPAGGGQLHCLVETVPLESDLPFQDEDMACTSNDDACNCNQLCGCDEINQSR